MLSIIFFLILFIFETSKVNTTALSRDIDINDPSLEIAKQFSKNSFEIIRKQPNTFSSIGENMNDILKKIKHQNCIYVKRNDDILKKSEVLNEFLAAKIFQYHEKINLMTIPELRTVLEGSFKIIKYNQEEISNIQEKIGSTSCKLEKITDSRYDKKVPVNYLLK